MTFDLRSPYGVGLANWQVPASADLPPFPAIVLYPASIPTTGASIGPFTFTATLDAPLAGGVFPLCVISHGGGGSHLSYRSIASHLAACGWVVVCPEHPFDNRNDRSRTNTDEAARDRPRHIVHTIDSLLTDARFGAHIDRAHMAMVGHSMGGFTALALCGGQPWSITRVPLGTISDPRIRAAVLLAPAVEWYRAPGALDQVTAPLLVLAGEHDPVTPLAPIREILAALPHQERLKMEVVPGAGHFSFMTPFPPALARPDFPPANDPPGFDRDAYHTRLPLQVEAFLRERVLSSR